MEKYYITTAIDYTSGKPHIGNNYEKVLGDSIARHKKLQGYDVYYQTGTDEHGAKIAEKASEASKSPQEYVDEIAALVKESSDSLNVEYNAFVRTTDKKHIATVSHIFKKLYDQGDIYKGEYKGWYCKPCESFFTDLQLEDGKCPDCHRDVTEEKEEAYFFKLSKYTDKLLKYYEENPKFILPEERKTEMINNFIKPGLQDLCVSRSTFTWGVPVSFDTKHVVYVWIDALSNYITFLGYDVDEQSELFKKFWPADVHLVGKDILRFHCIYWPIILLALEVELPKQIFAHPWYLFGTDKMSKSRGNILYADELSKIYGVDAIRYYLLSEMPYLGDGSITPELIVEKYNSDLANTLGNLVSRTVSMNKKYFDNVIPAPGVEEELDIALKNKALSVLKIFSDKYEEYRISDAISTITDFARSCNKYIDETTPWILAKENEERLKTVIYNLLESIRFLAVLYQSIMPETSKKILNILNTDKSSYESISTFGNLDSGTSTNEAENLFPRIEEK